MQQAIIWAKDGLVLCGLNKLASYKRHADKQAYWTIYKYTVSKMCPYPHWPETVPLYEQSEVTGQAIYDNKR